MAIRIALGAEPTAIVRMVSGQGIAVAAIGIVIGLAGALFLTRFLTRLPFEVSVMDPSTFAGAVGLLLAVAAAASWLPARRAAGIEPAIALRAE
jgi:putative ABC transport system permease protein